LVGRVDEAIALIAAAQRSDGYLNTYYQLKGGIENRWTNLRDNHELYCLGHLIQAAVAHNRCTGKDSLLGVACRFADYAAKVFGRGRNQGMPGHPEIEMALVELYRETGVMEYLDLARFFIDTCGSGHIGGRPYHQDHVPVREAAELAGHAVRQLYLICGVTDVFLETGDPSLWSSLERLWQDMVSHKMSVTGGVGARHDHESFDESYELPNDRVYNETCAQIASVMWNWRMLLATGEAAYADLLEWTLYNGVLSGISLNGARYFYPNPLLSRGNIERSDWFDCACCPPNIMRTLSSVQNYLATTDEIGIQIHLYDSASIDFTVPAAGQIELKLETRYPWEDGLHLTVLNGGSGRSISAKWELAMRVPPGQTTVRSGSTGWAPQPRAIPVRTSVCIGCGGTATQ
jgi:DUF1680 family protein